VELAATTSFTLTCTGPGGSVTEDVTVEVEAGEAVTIVLSVTPNEVMPGQSATIAWIVSPPEGASTNDWIGFFEAEAPDDQQFPEEHKQFTQGEASGELSQAVPSFVPLGTYEIRYISELEAGVYQIRARAGLKVVDVVEPPPASEPTLTLSANPTAITAGEVVTVSWTSTDAESCEASGDWTGAKPTNGNAELSPATTVTYRLTCTGSGGSVTEQVVVEVTPVEPPQDSSAEGIAYQHLRERMDHNINLTGDGPRLIASYMSPYPDGMERVALVADNAMAILAFLASGTDDDLQRARLLSDALLWSQEHDLAGDGRLRPAYLADQPLSGELAIAESDYTADTGTIAWAALALMDAHERLGDAKYLDGAIQAADFLLDEMMDASQGPGVFRGFAGVPDIPFYVSIRPRRITDYNWNSEFSVTWTAPPAQATNADYLTLEAKNSYYPMFGTPYMPLTSGPIATNGQTEGAAKVYISGWMGGQSGSGRLRYIGFDEQGHEEAKAQFDVILGGEETPEDYAIVKPTVELRDELSVEKRTDQNALAYVLFQRLADTTGADRWLAPAASAKQFIEEQVWNEKDGHFWFGTLADQTTDRTHLLVQPQALAVMAFGNVEVFGRSLVWVDGKLKVTSDGFSGFDAGLNADDGEQPDGVWFEGTAQMAAAYEIAGNAGAPDDSAFFIMQLENAQSSSLFDGDGKGIVAASHDGVTSGLPDLAYAASRHIGTTAWYLLAKRRINPLWGTSTDQPVPHEVLGSPLTLQIISPDVDGDGTVTMDDVDLVVEAYGRSKAMAGDDWPMYAAADLNGDGAVSIVDILIAANSVGLSWPPAEIQEGRKVQFYVKGAASSGNTPTYTATGLPTGACFNGRLSNGSTGTCQPREFFWVPSFTQAGSYRITFAVSDGVREQSEMMDLTVRDNQPPVLDAIGNKSVAISGKLAFPVTGSDPDGDPLSFQATGLPSGATFEADETLANTWNFSWTPEQFGIFNVKFSVYDGAVSTTEQVTITVAPEKPADLVASMLSDGRVRLTWVDHSSSETGFRITRMKADGSGGKLDVWVPNAQIQTIGTTADGKPKRSWTDASVLAPSMTYTYRAYAYAQLADGSKVASVASNHADVRTPDQNLPPVLAPIGNKTVAVSGKLEFTVTAVDPAQEPVTLEAWRVSSQGVKLERIDATGNNTLGATFTDKGDGTGQFVWSPSAAHVSQHWILFVALDPAKQADSETITVTVQ